MNIIVGATGQIGSLILRQLKDANIQARAVLRNPAKLFDKTLEFRQADLFSLEEVKRAFEGGSTAFLITPEDPNSNDPIGDAEKIVENYRSAVITTGIQKVIVLSSIGAHLQENTGNLAMSRILEQGFEDLAVEKIFIRPSYYYSNWLPYLDIVKQYGTLPTFFPENLALDMNAPEDVAKFIVLVLSGKIDNASQKIIELTGPGLYSSSDVATILSKVFGKEVQAQQIPKENWRETLLSAGFTENAAKNIMEMTQVVVDGMAIPENPDKVIRLSTTLQKYFEGQTAIEDGIST
ncbi:NmrA family NAD(P)-binding protein [Desertivirga arenae]|uniref:NmrA family NAD(P)-binding protein n=1 Tax=Desertivirga arenae TaxID=2810309 RepID=UPI001A96F794|nr:NmrA family NAD(P)-binding protein [Pedobacter sp. SYSU D00823]